MEEQKHKGKVALVTSANQGDRVRDRPTAGRRMLAYGSATCTSSAIIALTRTGCTTRILVNVANPGFVATSLNDHRTVPSCRSCRATMPVAFALGPSGATGTFRGYDTTPSRKPCRGEREYPTSQCEMKGTSWIC